MVRRTSAYVVPEEMEARALEWVAEIRSRVRPRPHFRLDPGRCGLVVVDMLRYFADPEGRCYLPGAGAIVPGLTALLEAWRETGGMVVYTRHCHEGPHDLGMLGRFYSDHIACGEPDSQIISALAPAPGETVVRKTTYDAFHGTRLEGLLRDAGKEQVLVTGVLTHLCCETTARAAFVRGFEVYVPVDGTASNCEQLHLSSLRGLADGVGVINTISEVCECCREKE